MIASFRGKYNFLSNYHPCPNGIDIGDGLRYPTTEHAYQAAKTFDMKVRKTISELPTPHESKKMGQIISCRPDWEQVKIAVMEDVLRKKFTPGSELAAKLVATGEDELVEGNYWNDRFWGQCPLGDGQNNLGKLLMKLRKELAG